MVRTLGSLIKEDTISGKDVCVLKHYWLWVDLTRPWDMSYAHKYSSSVCEWELIQIVYDTRHGNGHGYSDIEFITTCSVDSHFTDPRFYLGCPAIRVEEPLPLPKDEHPHVRLIDLILAKRKEDEEKEARRIKAGLPKREFLVKWQYGEPFRFENKKTLPKKEKKND